MRFALLWKERIDPDGGGSNRILISTGGKYGVYAKPGQRSKGHRHRRYSVGRLILVVEYGVVWERV